ncbi:MAG TPA: HlyD family secretion protein [Gemmatimonadales bacterium]|jgi:membrane fusion protein (multidrug efflux system)
MATTADRAGERSTETRRSPITNVPVGPGEESPASRRGLVLGIAGLFAAALVVGGAYKWYVGLSHVTTDDAQVEGHIIPVLPRIGGFVQDVRVKENQPVKAGDTLIVLDGRDFAARLAQADAELATVLATVGTSGRVGQAAAQLSAARASAAAADASVIQAQANADKATRDVERYRSLAARNVVSGQQLDQAETVARAAQAQLTAAERSASAANEQVVAAEAALRGADARVAGVRAQRDQAELQLSYTHVVAPMGGVVTKKNVEVGQLVQPGQPLMTVVPMDDIWVVANLKETQLKDVKAGDAVEITVDAYPGRSFAGHVESVSPATGARFSMLPPDNATGNFTKVVQRVPVRVRLDQPQDPAAPLRPGMSVDVDIKVK